MEVQGQHQRPYERGEARCGGYEGLDNARDVKHLAPSLRGGVRVVVGEKIEASHEVSERCEEVSHRKSGD